jgi:hypothetical protein
MAELSPQADAARERFLRLVAANIGRQTAAEIRLIMNEVFTDDSLDNNQKLSQLADLLAVSAAVGAAWAHDLAERQEFGTGDAIEQIDAGIRAALKEGGG